MNPQVESTSSGATPASLFVGREEELGALRAGLERAIAGLGSVYLVAGEPGIGKTELVDRLAAEAESRGVGVLWARLGGRGSPGVLALGTGDPSTPRARA
jgi:predicted ATP-dependent serine protease